MTQKDKELLLKDLSARLPYGVKYMDILNPDEHPSTLQSIDNCGLVMANDGFSHEIENVKPYLFPLSSMTEEQKEELFFNYIHNDIYFDDFTDYFLAGELWHDICVSMNRLPELIDWLIKNHFDYNSLIPKGLAIDCTYLNIY